MVAMIFGGREKNWALIVGSDHNNSDAGLTLLYGRKPPEECDEINEAWRHIWRLNIRWPVTLRHRRPVAFPGRFRNHEAVQRTMRGFSWDAIRTASEIEAERLAVKSLRHSDTADD